MATLLVNPVLNGKSRGSDRWGSGSFGAPRGSRQHNGLDIAVVKGEDVLSPIDGVVIRKAYPYASDLSYTGVLIEGAGVHAGIIVKMFYISPSPSIIGSHVKAGDKIGSAQDLTRKYSDITNHIHIEVIKDGVALDPKRMLSGIIP